jgi:hypothetical protein
MRNSSKYISELGRYDRYPEFPNLVAEHEKRCDLAITADVPDGTRSIPGLIGSQNVAMSHGTLRPNHPILAR